MSKPTTEMGAELGIPESAEPWIRISSMLVFWIGASSNPSSVSEVS
jgi:hypothetical protein